MSVSFFDARRLAVAFVGLFLLALPILSGCNTLKGGDSESDEYQSAMAERMLKNMHKNLQNHLINSICVLAVVDNSMGGSGAEEEAGEEGETSEQAMLRRERIVRAAITSNLVHNSKLRVVDAPQSLINEYHKLLQDKNANALSEDEAKRAGEQLNVLAVITAFVEDEGRRISITATATESGKVVFSEILVNWNYEKKTTDEKGEAASTK